MIVTEEEAKTKRCQESFPACANVLPEGVMYASVWHYPPPPTGHGAATAVTSAPTRCLGSDCMAWRWQLSPSARGVDRQMDDDRTLGYCGKAGRP